MRLEEMPWESTALKREFLPEPAQDARLVSLVAEHLGLVWRTLRRLGLDAGEADDAAQHVMLLAARRLDQIATGSERAFVMAAALRVAAGARRKRERRREVVGTGLFDSLAQRGTNPEDLLEQRRARELLDELIGELPFDLSAVFVLYEFEQLSMVEIGEVLGLKLGTVASRLRRSRAEFDRQVKRWEARARRGGGSA